MAGYPNADSYNVITNGSTTSGTITDTEALGGNDLQLAEIKNATPGFDYEFHFSSVPSENYTVNLVGRY